jgi:AMME syndrome candidate gene 1 protein
MQHCPGESQTPKSSYFLSEPPRTVARTSQMAPAASLRADRAMCAYAFDVLLSALDGRGDPPLPATVPDALGVGVFVTWNSRGADGSWDLRGCVGTLTQTQLGDALPTYARHSALRDSRFEPLTKGDLSTLQAVVSVLSGFEEAPGGVYDWTIDVHGVVLSIQHGRYTATYLPEICGEQGWTKQECIASLARKAGFRGRLTPAILETAELTRYGTFPRLSNVE